jgi:hypothetical protein
MGGTCAARADLVLFQRSSVGVSPQGARRYPTRSCSLSDRATWRIALPQGDAVTRRMGFPAIQGCARKSHRLAKIGEVAQQRIAQASKPECFADGRRSRPVKNAALDGAADRDGLLAPIVESWASTPSAPRQRSDRERQKQDDDLRSRPTTPTRKEHRSESSVRSSSGPGGLFASGDRGQSTSVPKLRLGVKRG